ncbi:hypothetical protein [Sulfurospirillum arcachonense]|uniref:hypothetical protein n=1 Tax=Sulfurospirillum arcachonense TaxID=57666 RepID=UPI0012ECAEF1|nr:hypothetical protein [Sulfurospirillum arcachonense]
MSTTVNKKAFVLIEIIVSVVLLSIAGTALFKASANQKKLYSITSKKTDFLRYTSLVLNKHSTDLHNKDINLYDFSKSAYSIKNDNLIKILKNTKVHYSQKNQTLLSYGDTKENNSIDILIDEITLSNTKSTSKYLSVKM